MERVLLVIICTICTWCLPVQATLWRQNPEPVVRIGAIQITDLEEISSEQAILLDRLRREMHPRLVTLQYYTPEELTHAIKNKSVEFFISDAAFYATVEHSDNVMPLAGLVYPEAVDADHMTAATVFVAKGSEKTQRLADIKGKKALVLQKNSFGGDIVLRAQLLDSGFDPQDFFSSYEQESEYNVLVKRVLSQKDLVGVLPACTLERLAEHGILDLSEITVIDQRPGNGLNCLKSTDVYPGWVLAGLSSVDMPLIRKITSIALISSSAERLQWSFPPKNFQSVHNALIDLHIGPYAEDRDRLWADFFYRYRWWILSALILVCAVLAHSFLVTRLVRIRTRDIQNLMIEQQKMTEEILEARSRLQSMEKIQTVSQMCTMFAHELKQPLGAIRNFSLGLLRRSERKELDEETMTEVLGKILFLADRASNVVTHVRSYAQSKEAQRHSSDLVQTVRAIIQTFTKTTEIDKNFIDVNYPPFEISVWINTWEIELLVFNLLKNAAEAVVGIPNPHIGVYLFTDEHHAILRISDNGGKVDDETLQNIFKPLFSTKHNGLGLGLAIAVRVAESHGGRINASRNSDGGLTMELVLPLDRDKDS